MKLIFSKDKVVELIGEILSLITNPRHISAFKSINAQQYHMTKRFREVFLHLQNVRVNDIVFSKDLKPDVILHDLKAILEKWSEIPTTQQKTDLGEVVKRVLRMLSYILSMPTMKEKLNPLLPKTIISEIDRLRDARLNVLTQIEIEEKKGDKNNESRIAELNATLASLSQRIELLQKDKSKIDEAYKVEQDMDARIKEAFKDLSSYTTVLETERKTIVREYNCICVGILITLVVFSVWLCKFYGLVLCRELYLPYWYSLLPYYLPVPVFVAAFWVLLFQKNRASRLSNALSERLFQIHYLEGLLITSNKLVVDTETSLARLNGIINTIVNGYLSKMNFEQLEIDNDEQSILKVSDAENILKHIEELIKVVKK